MDYREAFTRQRRNLILFSCLVLFVNVAGATINQINLLGNVLAIKDPEVVSLSFFLVLFYFLIRYLQYSHAIHDKGIAEAFSKKRDKLLGPRVLKRVHQKFFSDEGSSIPDARSLRVERFWLHPHSRSKLAFIAITPRTGGQVFDFDHQDIFTGELRVTGFLAALYVLFQTHLVTEYVFPLMISLVAFASFFSSTVSCLRQMIPS